ncbi:MAG: histone deacetylase [Gemmatimonadota bacterium]|nr:MAG: histone deacetylase [Gemmatimonadota bacterium]
MSDETSRLVWSDSYEVDIGDHVFPTAKYGLVKDQLLAAGIITPDHLVGPQPADSGMLGLVHEAEYLEKIRSGGFSDSEIRIMEVPFSAAYREASIVSAGATTEAGRIALRTGTGVHLGGGFHHAFAGHGEGFCMINDVAVAAMTLLRDDAAERIAIVDLDVHHGNGTATIFADEPRVFTFSMHHQWNYPALKPPSDLDVGLDDGMGDEEYLRLLDEHLPTVLEQQPDVIFYLAGADPFQEDQLGGLALTKDGLRARDEAVLTAAGGAGVPVAVTLAGGYAIKLMDTVDIHCATVEAALGPR